MKIASKHVICDCEGRIIRACLVGARNPTNGKRHVGLVACRTAAPTRAPSRRHPTRHRRPRQWTHARQCAELQSCCSLCTCTACRASGGHSHRPAWVTDQDNGMKEYLRFRIFRDFPVEFVYFSGVPDCRSFSIKINKAF